ncbi:MAG: hypothetical protein KC589_04920 [Nanoarchaeota archaeon]|nr:hypothetical protein [Nanoarchaeota archaeon]
MEEKFSLRLVDGNGTVMNALERKFKQLNVKVKNRKFMTDRSVVYFLDFNYLMALSDSLDSYFSNLNIDFQCYNLRNNYLLLCRDDHVLAIRGENEKCLNKSLLKFEVFDDMKKYFEVFLKDKKIPYLVDLNKQNTFRILDKYLEEVVEGWHAKSYVLYNEDILDCPSSFNGNPLSGLEMIIKF